MKTLLGRAGALTQNPNLRWAPRSPFHCQLRTGSSHLRVYPHNRPVTPATKLGVISQPMVYRGNNVAVRDERLFNLAINNMGLRQSDTVLVLGSGDGSLALNLAQLSNRVVVVEPKEAEAHTLRERIADLGVTNIDTVIGDPASCALGSFDVACIVHNDYRVAVKSLFRLLEQGQTPHSAFRNVVALVPLVIGRRIVAPPGSLGYSRLSVDMQRFAEVEVVKYKINKGWFSPQPRAATSMIKVTPLLNGDTMHVPVSEWSSFTKCLFYRRREKVGRQLAHPRVMSMLEANYKSWCSMNRKAPSLIPFRDLVTRIINDSGIGKTATIDNTGTSLAELHGKLYEEGIRFANIGCDEDLVFDLDLNQQEDTNERECSLGHHYLM